MHERGLPVTGLDRERASQILELMLEFARKLDESVRLVQTEAPNDAFDQYRASVGKLMGVMLLDIMNPIFDEHPDLKPERLR